MSGADSDKGTGGMVEGTGFKARAGSYTDDVDDIRGFAADKLPRSYYRSRFFLGSFFAIGLGLWSGTAAFGYAAPLLTYINEDIGPDPNYVWISLIYNTVLAVCLIMVGRLSDIFGRRYFFIGGGVLSLVGCIVCATAKTIPVLIGGNVLLGAATSTQLSFHFVLGELVPMKYRYFANALIYAFTFPGSGLGPLVAQSFIVHHPKVGWRGVYYLLIGSNAAALFCWVTFYFPPTFHQKHKNDSLTKWLRHFDYVGMVLFSSGFVVFLLGLSWGGSVYPWDSAPVISTIVVGFVVLVIFVLWECFANLKEPFVPMYHFRNTEWVASCVLLGLGAGIYYAFSIIWPQQVATLYTTGNLMADGGLNIIVGLGIVAGQVSAGILTNRIGWNKLQVTVAFLFGGVFLGCVAVGTPDNRDTVIALVICGCFLIGWAEAITIANTTITVKDQQELGVAGGIAGSIRSAVTTILTAVYTTILSNRLAQTVPEKVPGALTNAGLPASSVAQFIESLAVGEEALKAVPGVNANIIAAGTRAYQFASAEAYRTVYLSTIAFSGLALITCWFSPNIETYMTEKVAAVLNESDNSDDSSGVADEKRAVDSEAQS